MNNRLELIEKNRDLILETLEHIKNVTNIGITVKENTYNISISLPNELISTSYKKLPGSFVRSGGQLVFFQDPNDGIKIKHKMPQVKEPGNPLTGEEITSIPASALSREIIFKKVIEFLERIQKEPKAS